MMVKFEDFERRLTSAHSKVLSMLVNEFDKVDQTGLGRVVQIYKPAVHKSGRAPVLN